MKGFGFLAVCFFTFLLLASSATGTEFTRTCLYENWDELTQKDSVSFVGALKHYEEGSNSLPEYKRERISTEELGLFLTGVRIDERNYLWIFTEKGKIIEMQLVTKK